MTRRRHPLLLVVAVALGSFVTAGPASAHDDKARIEVAATPSALAIDYRVGVTYSSDGHPAGSATVTVVAEAGGTTVGPVALAATAEAGTYAGRLALPTPGTWEVRISTLGPNGVVERTEQVQAPVSPTTAAAPTSTTAPVTTTVVATTVAATATTSTGATTAPTGSATSSTVEELGGSGIGGSDDGTTVFVVLVVVVVLGGAFVAWSARRRRQR